ncbi:MAG TPA: LemA family protein [Ottowia sp.]|uniref:LemA family protein n=1 Tax=Ottowia sp. TaxID=1898956 RepID=UPI002CE23DC2|nr:LemA family protein [Ottowia sp.]HMN22634.1 LemA family protein [Ottowia sp.]
MLTGSSMLAAGLLALLLFWATGAYNRLARMRSAVGQAFAELDRLLLEQLGWLRAALPASLRAETSGTAEGADEAAVAAWTRLAAAGEQLAVALQPVRARPADRHAIDSLVLARAVLRDAWDEVLTCGWFLAEALPSRESLQAEWDRLQHQEAPLIAGFNDAVRAYNQAVAQFPAVLLAPLFGFRLARPLAAGSGGLGDD